MKISEHESEGQPNGWTDGRGERASRGGKKRRNKEAPEERKRNRGEWPDIGTEKEGKRERERAGQQAGRSYPSLWMEGESDIKRRAGKGGRKRAREGGREGRRRGRN